MIKVISHEYIKDELHNVSVWLTHDNRRIGCFVNEQCISTPHYLDDEGEVTPFLIPLYQSVALAYVKGLEYAFSECGKGPAIDLSWSEV